MGQKSFPRYCLCVRSTDGFPSQKVGDSELSCLIFVSLNKLLGKRSCCWWFQMPSSSCDVIVMSPTRSFPGTSPSCFIKLIDVIVRCFYKLNSKLTFVYSQGAYVVVINFKISHCQSLLWIILNCRHLYMFFTIGEIIKWMSHTWQITLQDSVKHCVSAAGAKCIKSNGI